jgi:hypothetical protein
MRSGVVDDSCWHARMGMCSEVRRDEQKRQQAQNTFV